MNRQRFQLKNFYKPLASGSKKDQTYYSRDTSPNQIDKLGLYYVPPSVNQSYKQKPRIRRAHEIGLFETKTIDIHKRFQLSERRGDVKNIYFQNKSLNFEEGRQKQNKLQQSKKQTFKKQLKQIIIDEEEIFSFQQIKLVKQPLSKKANTNQSSPVASSCTSSRKHSSSFMNSISSLLFDSIKSSQTKRKPTQKDFTAIKLLGKGKYSKSYLVRQKHLNFVCVLKQISKETIKKQNILDRILFQIKIHSSIRHPNIIECYGVFETQTDICLILQYAEDGKLSELVNKFKQISEILVSHYSYDISMAIEYLHSKRILHRDLKPDNVLLSNGVVKLFGFGWGSIIPIKKSTLHDKFDYGPPEISQINQYNESVDMWGLGIIVYQLATRKSWGSYLQDTLAYKSRGRQIQLPFRMSSDLKDFIQSLLKKDPIQRMTLSQVWRHPFIKKHNTLL